MPPQDAPIGPPQPDPRTVILTCADCGGETIERMRKLICRCGSVPSCSDDD